ncbi:hypothetical protein [Ferruginibacter sp.]
MGSIKKLNGKRIAQLREQKGWCQSDLARACSKGRQAIENWKTVK